MKMCNYKGKDFIDNSHLMAKYEKYLKGEKRSKDTIESYMISLGLFFNHLSINTDEVIVKVNAEQVREFLNYLVVELGRAVTTRNLRCAAIKQFYEYLRYVEKYEIDMDILHFESIRPPHKEPVYLGEDEVEHIIEATKPIRSKTIITLLLRTGLRISELINIKLKNCKLVGEDQFGRPCYDITVKGKGNKERTVYADYELTKLIDKYITKRRAKILERLGKDSEYLFVSTQGNKMDRSNIRKMIQVYGLKIDFDQVAQLSPHKLRHSYATNKLDEEEEFRDKDGNIVGYGKKNDIKTVSESLGHSNIATTNRYTHTNKKKISKMQRGG